MIQTVEGIKVIAFEAREAFEKQTIARPLLRSLYLEYDPNVRDIDGYLDFAEKIFPEGNCGLAAVYLKHLLGGGEILRGEYIIQPHEFLELGGVAVDITVDQFGGPEVYVGPLVPPWGRSSI